MLLPDHFAAQAVSPRVGNIFTLTKFGYLGRMDVMPDLMVQRLRETQFSEEGYIAHEAMLLGVDTVHEYLDPRLILPGAMMV